MKRKVLHALLAGVAALAATGQADAQVLPLVDRVEAQPLLAQVQRVTEALEVLGTPLPEETKEALAKAAQERDDAQAVKAVQAALDPHCLLGTVLQEGGATTALPGPARPELVEQGWRNFLVKVYNEPGTIAVLLPASLSAKPLAGSPASDVENRWLDLLIFRDAPLSARLSGLRLEYRILQLYSQIAGTRRAALSFVGTGGPYTGTEITFQCLPSAPVTLRVLDENGQPATARFIIRDRLGRIYPPATKRLAPDFTWQPQVYRADGDPLRLPPGEYRVEYGRGPEYLVQSQSVVTTGATQTLTCRLTRWIDPSLLGWWSGDHHIHAAGCSHYNKPTEGVHAPDLIRHCLGEDLKVGCALNWGPSFDYQKQFFTGAVDAVSHFPYLLRYDVEVSGFGSHQSGHLCLLRLAEHAQVGESAGRGVRDTAHRLGPGGPEYAGAAELCHPTLQRNRRE
jgi:hypothetical protein